MIDGNVKQFIESLYYEDAYFIFQNEKYFANGCCCTFDENQTVIAVTLEIYNLDKATTVFSITKQTQEECVKCFEESPIFDGKTFWEVENNIQLIDN